MMHSDPKNTIFRVSVFFLGQCRVQSKAMYDLHSVISV